MTVRERALTGWSAVARRADVVSGLGWAIGVATVAAWVGALVGGWEELAVAAIVLTVVILGAAVLVVGRMRYDVEVRLAEKRVTVGDRATGVLDVRNVGSRPALPSVVELVVGRGAAAFAIPRLRPGAAHEDVFRIPTARRAVVTIGPASSVRSDPLGIFRRTVDWGSPTELVVHPRTVPLGGSRAGILRDLEGRSVQVLTDSDVSFHALRDYVPGDDRRHIHWRSTARTGQLVVRQFEETRRSQLAVVLSTRAADYADPQEFEIAVSVAGSLGLQAIREDRGVVVRTQHGALRGSDRTRLLDDLTAIETSPVQSGLPDVVRAGHAALRSASTVVLVTGSRTETPVLRAAAARLPGDARTIAVRCATGATPSGHRAGDVAVLTLGDVDDLPAALRRTDR